MKKKKDEIRKKKKKLTCSRDHRALISFTTAPRTATDAFRSRPQDYHSLRVARRRAMCLFTLRFISSLTRPENAKKRFLFV